MLRRFILSCAAVVALGAFSLGTIAVSAEPKPGAQPPGKAAKPDPKKPAPKPTRDPAPAKPAPTKPAPAPAKPAPAPAKPAPAKPAPAPAKPAPAPVKPAPEPPKPGPRHPGPIPPHPTTIKIGPITIDLTPPKRPEELAERLLLLEFSDKHDPKCLKHAPLVDEMKRKGFPIHRVERGKDGKLFAEYKVRRVPTFVLFLDGEEYDRVVVKDQRAPELRVELLTLFQRGRVEAARRPRPHHPRPMPFSPPPRPKPRVGFIFRSDSPTDLAGGVMRGQAADAESDSIAASAQDPAPVPLPNDRLSELSDVVGKTRLERALGTIFVSAADGAIDRTSSCVAIHYNEEFQETLFLVTPRLFDGLDVNTEALTLGARVYSPTDGKTEDVVAQCVYNDPASGVALVAARVSTPACPVAFLPKQASAEIGEDAYEFMRKDAEIASNKREVLAVDQRRFYQKEGAPENHFVLYDQLAGQSLGDGAACFVVRNGRFYFAGLASSADGAAETTMTPVAIVEQALLSNRNLSAVYRDQLSGKFDVPATQEEIQYALNAISGSDAVKPEYAIAQNAEKAAQAQDPEQSAALFDPEQPVKTEEPVVQIEPTKGYESLLADLEKKTAEAKAQADAANAVESSAAETPAPAPQNDETQVAAPQHDASTVASVDASLDAAQVNADANEQVANEQLSNAVAAAPVSPVVTPAASAAPTVQAEQSAIVQQSAPQQTPVAVAQTEQPAPQQAPVAVAQTEQPAPQQALVAVQTEQSASQQSFAASAVQTGQAAPQQSFAASVAQTEQSAPQQAPAVAAAQTEQSLVQQAPAQNDFASSVAEFAGAPEQTIPALEQNRVQEPVAQPAAQRYAAQYAQPAIAQYAPAHVRQTPVLVSATTPDGKTIQYYLNPAQTVEAQPVYAPAQAQFYAAPNGGVVAYANPTGVVPTAFSAQPDPQAVAAFEREEEEFNAALDVLKRHALDGAEIVCIVNYSGDSPNASKEAEVVRLPKRTIAERPTARSSNVELVAAPAPQNVPAAQQYLAPAQVPAQVHVQAPYVPLTAGVTNGATVK